MALSYQLNKRVTIQARGTAQDANGEVVNTWTNFVTDGDGKVWAEVRDISGREYLLAGAEQAATQTRITIRYREGIVPAMRVLDGATVYNVAAVLGTDRRTLLLMCGKGLNSG